MGNSSFERFVKYSPFNTDELIGSGLSHFIKEQKPSKIKFVVHAPDGEPVGYSIKIKTDKKNIKGAKDFWENHVEDKL